jgi:two-component system chemotaxis response regulator CheY
MSGAVIFLDNEPYPQGYFSKWKSKSLQKDFSFVVLGKSTPWFNTEPMMSAAHDEGIAIASPDYEGHQTLHHILRRDIMGLGRVLVVDDEENIRKVLRMTLTKAGYDVVEAEDGEKGIAAIRSGDNPLLLDTIICDIRMPKVNGVEAIAYFRAQFPSVPVIVLTGHPDPTLATALLKQGVVEYLTKPIEPEKLVAAVNKAVKEHVLFKDQFIV